MLSLFHNRRWDGDYLTIRDIIDRGLIGKIYHIECGQGGYRHPGFWWRSDKTISGGVMHDWGAHFIDWILNLVPSEIAQVMGDLQKHVWNAVSNEDHGQAYIRFENGVTADYWISSIAALSRPKWLILGTKGAIRSDRGTDIEVVSFASSIQMETVVYSIRSISVCANRDARSPSSTVVSEPAATSRSVASWRFRCCWASSAFARAMAPPTCTAIASMLLRAPSDISSCVREARLIAATTSPS